MKPYERVAGLLRARRWALAVLGGAQPPAAPQLSPELWARFLTLERCAAVLLDRLTSPGVVPAETLATLRAAAATESQSRLRARAEGSVLSEIASRLDFPLILLKGGPGAVAGRPPALPLVDIDILVDQSHVSTVTSMLRDAGFGVPATATRHHQGMKPSPDRLTVEVHWTTHDDGTPLGPDVWKRILPVPGAGSLSQLSAADNLEHILRHAVISHRDRSVALRDVILAGACALECTSEDLADVRSRIGTGRHCAILGAMLDMSLEVAAPSGNYPHDPFELEAASFYSATVTERNSARAFASASALAFVTELAIGRTSVSEAPARAFLYRGTGNASLARLAGQYPLLIKPVIGVAHTGYYGLASMLLLPRIRATATRALDEIGRRTH